MRFSYIDSQGKEIEVDSVESLALRIQLGAIKADTRMYDAAADRWALAEEHPVFRSLSRGEEIDEEEVVAIGQEGGPDESEEEGDGAAAEVEEEGEVGAVGEVENAGEVVEGGEDVAGSEPDEIAAAEPGEVAAGSPSSLDDSLDLDFEVSVTDEGAEEPEPAKAGPRETGAEPREADEEPGAAAVGDLEAKGEEAEDPDQADLPAAPTTKGDEGVPGGAGTTGLEGATPGSREREGEPGTEEPAAPEVEAPASSSEAARPRPTWVDEGEALWDVEDTEEAEGRRRGDAEDDGSSGSAGHREALEEDLADPRRQMPEWASDAADDVKQWDEDGDVVESPGAQGRTPGIQEAAGAGVPRPAHWDERRRARARRSRLVRVAQGVGVMLLVGAGAGYFLVGPGGESESEAAEDVAEPLLSTGQWSAMATAADRAWSDVLEEFRAGIPGYGLPYRPPQTWLDGIYLSNASGYPGVVEYWEGVEEMVQAMRARESALYYQYLDRHLERMAAAAPDATGASATVAAGDVPRILSVARTEYDRTAPARDSAYQQIRDLAAASLDLHALLVEREDDIVYEPYSDPQVSRDPVLEAVPADSLLRTEMNAGLDRVIVAITENDIPRPITTFALFNHLLAELGSTETSSDLPPPPEPSDS